MPPLFGTLPNAQSLLSFFVALVYLVVCVFAEYNVTVNATDSSLLYSEPPSHWTYWATTECGLSLVEKFSQTKGDSVTLTFTGTAIYLDVLADIYQGLLFVTLDGVSQEIVVSSFQPMSTCRYATAFSKSGLDNKLHTIQVTLDSTADANGFYRFLSLVSFRYTTSSPQESNLTPSDLISSSAVRPAEIAAIVIGTIALILGVTVAAILCINHRRRQSAAQEDLASQHPGNLDTIRSTSFDSRVPMHGPASPAAALPNHTGNISSYTSAQNTENLIRPSS